MSLFRRRESILFLSLTIILALHAQAAWGFEMGWALRPARNNPNDPKSPQYVGPPVATAPVPTLAPTPAPILNPTPAPPPCLAPGTSPQLVQEYNAFALDLLQSLNQTQSLSDNFTFSPFSVSTALAMAWAGARNNTAAQMAGVLHFQGDPATLGSQYQQLLLSLSQTAAAGSLDLNIANSLWENSIYTFLSPCLNLLQQGFSASLNSPDFSDPVGVVNQVNDWVAQETNQKIQSILSPGDVDPTHTAMLLLNAIYFKGKWNAPFVPQFTQPRAFHLADGSLTNTPMMTRDNDYYYFTQNADAQVLEIPYQGNSFSMVVVLPAQSSSLAALEAGLSVTKLNAWLGSMCPTYIQLFLPKLQLAFGAVDLTPNLQALGMPEAFDKDLADFSGLIDQATLVPGYHARIEFVKHKAVVDVDESGTEAAAVTAISIAFPTCVIQRPVPLLVSVDHPYLFLIRDKATGTILFIGRVMNPNAT